MFLVRQTEEFVDWLDGVKGMRAQVRIVARLRQAEAGNLGDWVPVEGEVSEFRTTQRRDIRRAIKLAFDLGEES